MPPLLAGRIHSYVDTQLSRLGGPNFHELPINAPLAPVHNNQRDGMHRQAIHRGRVAYEPNSLGGGCPFQAGAAGFVSFPEPIVAIVADELRGKPEKFAEHYNQATLFYESQAEFEKRHIADAFRFELSKCTVQGIRRRTVSMLRNVSDELAKRVGDGLGMGLPEPMPRALEPTPTPKPEVSRSPALSLLARPGDGDIRTRKVAILVAEGIDGASVRAMADALIGKGAVVRLVGPRIGVLATADGELLDADASLENHPSPLFDAVVVPDGESGVEALTADGRAVEFVRDQFRHGKTLLSIGAGAALFEPATIPLDAEDPGLLVAPDATEPVAQSFVAALGQHRHPSRESDPPRV